MTTELCDLCIRYGTDKGPRSIPGGWGYSPIYQELLEPMRDTAEAVLEVGICGYRPIPNNVVGASLFVWRDFFRRATIYGLDVDPRFVFNDQSRIRTARCDAYDLVQLSTALRELDVQPRSLDFVVDDAVHDPLPQLSLLHDLWPLLKVGGLYAIEEVCPFKMPDLRSMTRLFPRFSTYEVHPTHREERLVVLRKTVTRT